MTADRKNTHLIYSAIALFILSIYSLWYVGVWPGPMGQDGYSLIANINQGAARWTGKDPAWLLYALGTYGSSNRVESIVIPLLLIHVLIFTRIIGYTYIQGNKRTAIFFTIFIACAPHILNYASSLYADSVFSLAFIGILFEVWISLKNKKASPASLAIIIGLIPIAGFFKGNGIVILITIIYLAYTLQGSPRWILVFAAIAWILAIFMGSKSADLGKGHGALEPLILFETTNFMQSKPMNLWQNRHMVTPKTKEIIYRYISQDDIDKYYDRDYWDTLWHQNQDRVKFRHMTKEDRKALRREFFKYNLWRNIPAFTSSRINIFLASALAQGGILGPEDAKHGLQRVQTQSKYNPLGLTKFIDAIVNIFHASYNLRFLLWTPFIGIALLISLANKSIRLKNPEAMVICATLAVQLTGIFIFSIASEYRYLLIAFYSPIILYPMIQSMRNQPPDLGLGRTSSPA